MLFLVLDFVDILLRFACFVDFGFDDARGIAVGGGVLFLSEKDAVCVCMKKVNAVTRSR